MTMFTRSDRTADQDKPQTTPEALRTPATPQARPIATAQPLGGSTTPLTPAARSGSGVSVIGRAVKITGQIESSEDVQIDGQVEGDVRGVTVTVGNGARVKGTIYGETAEIAGTVEGKVEARKVVINATGHMKGDVIHADLRIESGAYIDGHCRPDYGKTAAQPASHAAKPTEKLAEKPAEKPVAAAPQSQPQE